MPPVETKPLPTKTGKKPRYFYGWNIVAAAFVANLSYAEHFSSNLGLFFKPLQAEFGWSRSALALIQTIARLTEAIGAPIVGPFIDRYGPRLLMPLGAIICYSGSLLAARANTIWQLYLLRGVVAAVGFTLMGILVVDVVVSNWFVRRRGRAIGITRLGINFSTFIMTPVTVFVIANSGWRRMFVVFAILTLVTVLLPSFIIMRRRPEDMGLYPDGIEPSAAKEEAPSEEKRASSRAWVSPASERTWRRSEVLRTSAFWLVVAPYAIDALALQGINISMAPYIQDLGYGPAVLAAILTFRGVVMAILSPFAGFVAEHADRAVVRAVPFLMQCIAASLFLLAKSPLFLWLAVVVYGTAGASSGITQAVIWADYFGRPSLGTVRSLGYLFILGFGAAGPVAMNAVYDLTGSYHPAFISIIVLFLIASFLIWVVRPPKPKSDTLAYQPTL